MPSVALHVLEFALVCGFESLPLRQIFCAFTPTTCRAIPSKEALLTDIKVFPPNLGIEFHGGNHALITAFRYFSKKLGPERLHPEAATAD